LYLELMEGDILITAPSAGAKRNKLNQVTSGFYHRYKVTGNASTLRL